MWPTTHKAPGTVLACRQWVRVATHLWEEAAAAEDSICEGMLFYSLDTFIISLYDLSHHESGECLVMLSAEEFLKMWNITLHCYTDTVILTCAQKYHNNSISVRQWKLITLLFTSISPMNEHWRNEKWIIHYYLFLGPPYDSYDDCCNNFK